jgi:cytosine/adenosine deaminase-related metal-dependent hydrolase
MDKDRVYTARYILPILTPPIEDGALYVRSGRIVAVGPRDEVLREAPGFPCTDFGDSILLPPLVNAHTHLELTHFPQWLKEAGEAEDPDTFVDWVLQVIRVKRSLAPSRIRPSIEEGIRLSLSAGTGAVGDILSFFPAREAFLETPLKGRLYLETLGRDPEINRETFRTIEEIIAEERAGTLELGLSPHSPYSLSAEYLGSLFEFCLRQKTPAAIHLGESPEEVLFLRESAGPLAETLYPFVGWAGRVPPPAGLSPAAYLAERGGLVPWSLLVHGVQATDDDVRRIAEAGSTVILCPRSNARLGVGKAPVEKYLQAGVPLALGTDSLASSESLSVWDEMAFAIDWFEGRVGAGQLLKMVTLGGAAALGLEREMGALRPGAGANFQILTPSSLPPSHDLEAFLCSPGRTGEVAALFLDGRNILPRA